MKKTTPTPDLPIELFATPEDWAAWLAKHQDAPGIWLRLAKKAAELQSISYAEALDVALCYGWIDGLKKTYDGESWIQKFTPRRKKSLWSKINRDKVEALIAGGRMQPSGLAEVERARQDGRWDAAYDSPKNASVPDDLQAALDRSPKAKAFFATLNNANRYAVIWRVQTAKKPETRAKRVQQLVEMLERNEKIHS